MAAVTASRMVARLTGPWPVRLAASLPNVTSRVTFTYQEDESLFSVETAPSMMATLRSWPSVCRASIDAANRHYAVTSSGRYGCFRPYERLCRLFGRPSVKLDTSAVL
jgi:hypothetical protein